jgi:hypothetical protein
MLFPLVLHRSDVSTSSHLALLLTLPNLCEH